MADTHGKIVPAGELAALKLVESCNELHETIRQYAADAGERAYLCGQQLCKMKDGLPKGSWDAFADKHLAFSCRAARKYMQIARNLSALTERQRRGLFLTGATIGKLCSVKPEAEEPELEAPDGIDPDALKIMRALKCTQEQVDAMARDVESDYQVELAQSVKDGKQSMDQALETHDIPDPTPEEIIKEDQQLWEKFCRGVVNRFKKECPQTAYTAKVFDRAMEKVKEATALLRHAKYHGVCEECDAQGCADCNGSGFVTRIDFHQFWNG